jgi:hypothetical protein
MPLAYLRSFDIAGQNPPKRLEHILQVVLHVLQFSEFD